MTGAQMFYTGLIFFVVLKAIEVWMIFRIGEKVDSLGLKIEDLDKRVSVIDTKIRLG